MILSPQAIAIGEGTRPGLICLFPEGFFSPIIVSLNHLILFTIQQQEDTGKENRFCHKRLPIIPIIGI
jgi:hypothetical protein